MCPRRKPPSNNQSGQLVAQPNRQGGTYSWSPAGHIEGSGSTPHYWSRTEGLTNTASVTYSQGGEGASDTSGYIRVFDAELTLDGLPADPQDNTEETPGAYIALGAARRALTISTWPSDPDDVMNHGFQDDVPKDWPPYTMGLAVTGDACVQLYDAPTGGNLLTGDALTWGWEYDQSLHKFVEHNAPTQVYVQPVSVGTCNLFMSLVINGTWPAGYGGAGDTVKVNVISVDLLVNGTDVETDDYVAQIKVPVPGEEIRDSPENVPAGAEDNHIPLVARLNGPPGVTCRLLLSDHGGGDVEITKDGGAPLNPEGEPITVGTPLNLWLFGVMSSNALKDVTIEARTVETGDAICGSEDLTVIWFWKSDMFFRGSDHQDDPLTEGSTARFSSFPGYGWMDDVVGVNVYPKPPPWDWDFANAQMELRFQPSPNAFMGDVATGSRDLEWDIRRQGSSAGWGDGVPPLDRELSLHPGWQDDHLASHQDEDRAQNPSLTSLFSIDGPGIGTVGTQGEGLDYVDGSRFAYKGRFRNWVEVKIGEGQYAHWFVCSPYLYWHAILHLRFPGEYENWGRDPLPLRPSEVLGGNGTLEGFADEWTDVYEEGP